MVVGLKVTVNVQLPPGFTVVPQVLACVNDPVTTIFVMLRIPSPVLLSVTVWGLLDVKTTCLGNVRLVGERDTVGSTPVPVREMVADPFAPLSRMVTAALLAPKFVGVKVTEIVQLVPAATPVPQVFV
jgi:hypothetical protein